MHVIYLITNTHKELNDLSPNKYIGSKTNWRGDYWGTSSNPIMKRELQENPEHFKFEVLVEVPEVEKVNICTLETVEQLKVQAPENVEYYNFAYARTFSNTGYKWVTNGTKDLMVHPDKIPHLLSEGLTIGNSTQRGRTPWNKGIKRTDTERAKMSKSLKGRTVWNKGIKSGQDTTNKPLLKPYKAVRPDESTIEAHTAGQSRAVLKEAGLQWQSMCINADNRKNGKPSLTRKGWYFVWLN